MSHRAKPFTGKQKKLQLQEKRARKRNEGLEAVEQRSAPIVVGMVDFPPLISSVWLIPLAPSLFPSRHGPLACW
jgi:hypothetical protein